MKVIIIIGIVMFSLSILADIIIVIGKILDPYEFDNSRATIISDVFWLVFFILFLTQL